MLQRDIKPRDIMTPDAFHNAFSTDMAMGGSTNSVLHLLAIAEEVGVDVNLHTLNAYSENTPHPVSYTHLDVYKRQLSM